MTKAEAAKKALQAGKKTMEEIFEESPEFVQKILKGLKGESDDAVSKIGSGKNLDVLQNAKINAPSMDSPAYPKNIGRDEVNFTMPKEDPGFTMPHPEAQVPALRTQTLSEVIPSNVKPSIVETTGKIIPEVPVNPYTVGQAAPAGLGDIANSMKGQLDEALTPGMSNLKKGAIVGGGLLAGGTALNMLGGQDSPAAGLPQTPESASQALAAEKAKEMISKPAGPKDDGQFINPDQMKKALGALNSYGGSEGERAPAAEPQAPNYMELLRAAQQGQIDNSLVNNMLKAGQTIGNAISRSGEKPDYTVANGLQEQAGQGVANVLQQMKSQNDQTEVNDNKKLRDPNSDVSKAFRATLAKLGVPYTEKTTAWDAKAMGINPQNLLMQDRALEKQMKMMQHKEGKDRDAFVTGAQKTLLKPYQQYQKVANSYNSLQGYLKGESSGPKDVAILYDFIKALDPESAVKEGEIQLGRSAMSLMEQYGISAKKLTRSDILSPTFRNAISDIMKGKMEQARGNYEELAQPFKYHGAAKGLTEEDYGKFDYMSAADAKNVLKQNPTSVAQDQTVIPSTDGMVKVTNIETGKSKMMSAEQAARAPKDKYTVGN